MEIGVIVTIALFAVGVVYQTGRLTSRVELLAEDVLELKAEVQGLRREVLELSPLRPRSRSN
jgi:hypothetical protein